MSYKIIDIEGIGETYAARLNGLKVNTTEELLERAGTKKGRKIVAEATMIPEDKVLTWVNHADLMRVKGVAGQFSELLEAAGVDTVKELAQRNATNLHAKMQETNEKLHLTRSIPAATALQDMIDHAKSLEPKVFH